MRPLLVVEDDPLARSTLLRVLGAFGEVACAGDVDGAMAILAVQELSGLITDLDLAGRQEGGFEIIDAALASDKHAGLPVVLVTGSRETWAMNGAGARGATLLAKPDYAVATLMPFLDRVAAREMGAARLSDAITSAATGWGLTRHERQLLPWLVSGRGEKEICAEAGYAASTYRTYVKGLFAKSKCTSTAGVVIAVFRVATGTRR